MSVVAFLLCILVTTVTAIYLYRKLNPQGVLMLAGLVMLTFALILNVQPIIPDKSTGSVVFDLVKVVEETFIGNLSRAGLMIMTIGGYVAFMNHIKATNALVHISMKPLGFFRRYPYLAATVTIPIGQLLFITTPSAAGLGLLLVASVYPVLIGLGVSRLTALSVIAAATLFDQGPGSANTALAAELIEQTNVAYFITHQLPLVIPTTLVVMTLFYFNNRYFDKKEAVRQSTENSVDGAGLADGTNFLQRQLTRQNDAVIAQRGKLLSALGRVDAHLGRAVQVQRRCNTFDQLRRRQVVRNDGIRPGCGHGAHGVGQAGQFPVIDQRIQRQHHPRRGQNATASRSSSGVKLPAVRRALKPVSPR